MLPRRWVLSMLMVVLTTTASRALSEENLQGHSPKLADAVSLLKKGKYIEARDRLLGLLEKDAEGGLVPMYIAVALLRIERVEVSPFPSVDNLRKALEFAERALCDDCTLVAARMAKAVALARLGYTVQAEWEFNAILQAIRGREEYDELAKQAKRWLATLRPWSLQFQVGAHYDTNVTQVGQNVAIPREFDRREDFRFGVSVDGLRRVYLEDRAEVILGAGASSVWHADLDSFDEQSYRGSVALEHRATDLLHVGLAYEYDFNLLGREDYLSRHQLTPHFSILGPGTGTTFFYRFDSRRYFDVPSLEASGPFDRTGDIHVFGLAHTHSVGQTSNGDVLLQLGYKHENVSTRGTEYDARNDVLTASLLAPLPGDMSIHLGADWAWEDYKRRSTLDRFHRGQHALVQTYFLTVTKRLSPNVAILMEVLWQDDDSNIRTRDRESVFSYDRTLAGIALHVAL
ncbi:MAG: hypothetical protein JSU86_18535 [Phycisphaerales bacterium]|nr:MAG: hypothetical protein JSU86_18535 [Phycisphaerales bacterium]